MKKRRSWMLPAIVSAFYLAGTPFAVHASMTARTSQGAVVWAVSLVSFPFVAVPAYLVFGRNKFEGMSEAFNERQDEIDEFIRGFKDRIQPWAIAPDKEPSWHEAIQRLSGFELTRGNQADLLINGEATFDSILAGMDRARCLKLGANTP